jgi:hypothetical protein
MWNFSAVEKVAEKLLRFHQWARSSPVKRGSSWKQKRTSLGVKLVSERDEKVGLLSWLSTV